MKSGYSIETVSANILALERAGMPRIPAIRNAMNSARKSYFQRYPHGALPTYLAYPKERRLAQYYNPDGSPLRSNPVKKLRRAAQQRGSQVSRQIPTHRADVKKAARLYTDFSGHEDLKGQKVTIPDMPKTMLAFGYCDGILYSTVRDGKAEKYIHRFRKNSRPLLTAAPDGKQLFMLGGAYKFTERGIVDIKKPRRR